MNPRRFRRFALAITLVCALVAGMFVAFSGNADATSSTSVTSSLSVNIGDALCLTRSADGNVVPC